MQTGFLSASASHIRDSHGQKARPSAPPGSKHAPGTEAGSCPLSRFLYHLPGPIVKRWMGTARGEQSLGRCYTSGVAWLLCLHGLIDCLCAHRLATSKSSHRATCIARKICESNTNPTPICPGYPGIYFDTGFCKAICSPVAQYLAPCWHVLI